MDGVIARVLEQNGCDVRECEISILFCDDEFIRQLNKQYRGVDSPTDVLAFPQDEPSAADAVQHRTFGDIVVSLETARRRTGSDREEYACEVALLVIHGLLHIVGHDHEAKNEARRMRQLERKYLADYRESIGSDGRG